MNKQYIGDSVYCEYIDGMFKLTTENGLIDDPSNTICLEVGVLTSLNRYCEYIKHLLTERSGAREQEINNKGE